VRNSRITLPSLEHLANPAAVLLRRVRLVNHTLHLTTAPNQFGGNDENKTALPVTFACQILFDRSHIQLPPSFTPYFFANHLRIRILLFLEIKSPLNHLKPKSRYSFLLPPLSEELSDELDLPSDFLLPFLLELASDFDFFSAELSFFASLLYDSLR